MVTPSNEINMEHVDNRELAEIVIKMVADYQPKASKQSPVAMKIVLTDDEPVYQTPRRMSLKENAIIEQQIENWLRDGVIRPSYSDYASPVVVVAKKDGSPRLCINFKKLNEKMLRDRYPLPLIEDQIDHLRGSGIYTTLDLKDGFFHVQVEEASRKYTSFVVPSGQYEFNRVPFGLSNAPSVFQRYIHNIFRPLLLDNIVLIYMDDIVILSKNEEQAVERLRLVLFTAAEYGLIIRWRKCQFLQKRIDYLGYEV